MPAAAYWQKIIARQLGQGLWTVAKPNSTSQQLQAELKRLEGMK